MHGCWKAGRATRGLDLSSTTDLTTLVLVFPPLNEDDAYTVLPFFWLPEDTLALRVRRDHVMYDVWEKQGFPEKPRRATSYTMGSLSSSSVSWASATTSGRSLMTAGTRA